MKYLTNIALACLEGHLKSYKAATSTGYTEMWLDHFHCSSILCNHSSICGSWLCYSGSISKVHKRNGKEFCQRLCGAWERLKSWVDTRVVINAEGLMHLQTENWVPISCHVWGRRDKKPDLDLHCLDRAFVLICKFMQLIPNNVANRNSNLWHNPQNDVTNFIIAIKYLWYGGIKLV